MTLELSTLTDEYVRVRTSATFEGAAVDPTLDTVEMAFMADGDPANGDWQTASWETDTTTTPNSYYVRCLTGSLDAGSYEVWVKITDSPEIVVRRVGSLIVY